MSRGCYSLTACCGLRGRQWPNLFLHVHGHNDSEHARIFVDEEESITAKLRSVIVIHNNALLAFLFCWRSTVLWRICNFVHFSLTLFQIAYILQVLNLPSMYLYVTIVYSLCQNFKVKRFTAMKKIDKFRACMIDKLYSKLLSQAGPRGFRCLLFLF